MILKIYDASLKGTLSDLNVPEGEWVALHCDGDVAVSFRQDTAGYVALETVSAPGKRLLCTSGQLRLVTTGAVNIRLIKEKP